MANSLRAKLSKLRHDGHITDAEYQAFIKKMDGHDVEIRNNAIDEFVERARIFCINRPIGCDCRENIPLYAHTDGTWHDLIADIAEAMKGVKK